MFSSSATILPVVRNLSKHCCKSANSPWGTMIAVFGIFCHHFRDNLCDRVRYFRIELLDRYRLLGQMTVNELKRVMALKRQLSRQHFIKSNAESREVAQVVGGALHSPCLFRRHIGLGSLALVGIQRCPSFLTDAGSNGIMGQFNNSANRVDNNIGWFKILMNKVVFV